jgi:hypothetical protein
MPRPSTRPHPLQLTADQRERWHAEAHREGRTLSEWLIAAAELAYARRSTR